MTDRKVPSRSNSRQPSRYIPVRNATATARPVPSKIPRPTYSRGQTVGPGSRGSNKPSSSRQQAPVQDRPPPEPQPTPQEPQPPPPPLPFSEIEPIHRRALTPLDVDLIVPARQARPHTASGSRRQPQPPAVPPALQATASASGNPLAQPLYQLDWLPDEDQWISRELGMAYTDEALEVMKGHQLRSAKQKVAEGARENEVLYEMLESQVPFDVIDRFLGKGYEEDEAEQRETEYFEKLERMIADEADDIDLALTLSRLDMEKNPRREGVAKLDFTKSGRVRHQKQKFQRGLRSVRRGIEAMTVLAEEDEPEEMQPELAAAMMYTEEFGPGMTNPPNDMFAFLFSHQPEDTVEQPSEAGPLVAQEGRELAGTAQQETSGRLVRETSGSSPQIRSPGRLSSSLTGARSPTPVAEGPSGAQSPTSVAEGPSGARSPTSVAEGPSGARSPALSAEGSSGARSLVLGTEGPSSVFFVPARAPFLQTSTAGYPGRKVTKRFNLVQMCGSEPPCWFRGYFEAFPHTVGRIAISKSPSATLQTAWYVMRPETFKVNRRLIVPAL